MIRDRIDPFDFIFIDADKTSYPGYLARSLALAGHGAVIVADNVVRKGAVADERNEDPNVVGARAYLAASSADPRLTTTVLQTVGAKGHDGMAISLVGAPPAAAPSS